MTTSPLELLLPYQREIFDDRSRFVAWCSSRQVGKSFTGAARSVVQAMTRDKTDVLIVSPSERQSLEAMLKCRDWAEGFTFAVAETFDERDAPGAAERPDRAGEDLPECERAQRHERLTRGRGPRRCGERTGEFRHPALPSITSDSHNDWAICSHTPANVVLKP